MNNEDKILDTLSQLSNAVSKISTQMEKMDARLEKLEENQAETNARLSRLEDDVEIIKEDVAITRTATNTLLDWAEKAEVQIRIPLYNKAE